MEFGNVERITRNEAKALGLKRYFTGEPCKHGHISERRVCDYSCIECKKITSYKRYHADPSKSLKNNRAWHAAHPGYSAAKSAKRRQENPEQARFYVRRWFSEHPEQVKANNKRWRKANPGQVKAWCKRHNARKKGAEGYFSSDDIQQLYYDQGGLCLCGKTLFKHHIDHKTPISRGGSNNPSNLQLLCQPCNDRKGAKTMDEWRPTCAS